MDCVSASLLTLRDYPENVVLVVSVDGVDLVVVAVAMEEVMVVVMVVVVMEGGTAVTMIGTVLKIYHLPFFFCSFS